MIPRRNRAFTLIEVLLSLALFALATVVLAVAYLNVISGYAAMDRRMEEEEDWKFVREQVLTQPERLVLEAGGRLSLTDGRPVSWSTEIEESDVPDVFRVTLRVEATAVSGEREPWRREQTLWLLRPVWSEPAKRDELRAALQKRVEEIRSP